MIKTKIYPSGLRLVVDRQKDTKVINAGIMVNVGSFHEKKGEWGLAHMLEHSIFKSTTNHDFLEISKILDSMGIAYNAMTSTKLTYYYMSCIKDSLDRTMEIFSDMFFNAKFDRDEIEVEKKVVLEEMNMSDVDSYDMMIDSIKENMYYGCDSEHRILGKREVIEAVTPEILKKFKEEHYTADNIIITFVGNIGFDEAERLTDRLFASHFGGKSTPKPVSKEIINPNIKDRYTSIQKDEKQITLGILIKAPRINERDYDALEVYSKILGASRSSRLNEKIREREGLCYAISANQYSNLNTGSLFVGLSTSKDNVSKCLKLIREEIDGMIDTVTEEELNSAKVNLKTTLIFSQEARRYTARVNAEKLSVHGKISSINREMRDIDRVTLEKVNKIAKKIAKERKFVVCAVGDNLDVEILKDSFR